MTFSEWIQQGVSNGWCGPVVCYTHDGLPLSAYEEEDFYESDPCIMVIRVYDNEEMKLAVEEFHSPSNWRK